MSIQERVQAGVEWLNEQDDDIHIMSPWYDRIDLERLEIRSECNCVLGILARDIVNDPEANFFDICSRYGETLLSPESAVALGFDLELYVSSRNGQWDALEAEWRRVIEGLREGNV